MLESIKNLICFKSVDKDIREQNFDTALEKLNFLIKDGFRPADTYLKRGQLCHKLLMQEDAYSDFTYIIMHCADKIRAYNERLILNFEIGNYYEAVTDSNVILRQNPSKDVERIKFLSLVYSAQTGVAMDFILDAYERNKYKVLQFLFTETAKNIAEDELAKALKLLELVEMIDADNPIKLLKEANIYGLAGQTEKQDEILKRLDSIFPKYFISHFRFTDMYENRDLLEIAFLLELKIFDKHNLFAYPMTILEGYKNYMEGHIINAKECFENAIAINPNKAEAYVLLAQTLQLMSGYDNSKYKAGAEENYKIAMDIYKRDNIPSKVENMKRELRHLNSSIILK